MGFVYLPTTSLSYVGHSLCELEALNRFSARHFVPNGPPVADVVVREVDGHLCSCLSVLRRPLRSFLCLHFLFSLLVHGSSILFDVGVSMVSGVLVFSNSDGFSYLS